VAMAKTNAERARWRETLPWRQAEPALALADSGSIESDLAMDAGGAERYGPRPRYRAEDLIYEAWEAAGERRVALARQALALWPDCADAYVLLAQAASGLEEARELLEQGVAAGERALGRRVFREDVGDFWLIFETRPYMRARAAVAATLWRLGRREEAVEQQRELLRLNPRDNQMLRYRHAHWLLELEVYDELEDLFVVYAKDRMPGFVYAKALAAFAHRGDDACSRGLLDEARELNPHIPAYLTGARKLPEPRPAYIVFGEESEAVDYAAGERELWASVPGALAWLES
jgi:tetratricopeptide (TPR) repeat protein